MTQAIRQFQENTRRELEERPKDSVLWNMPHEERVNLIQATKRGDGKRQIWPEDVVKRFVEGAAK